MTGSATPVAGCQEIVANWKRLIRRRAGPSLSSLVG